MLAIGTLLVALNLGAVSSLSVFLKPISAEFGWPRGATALAYTIATASIGIAGVVWGRLADRFGTRATALVGALAQPAALLLLSRLGSLPQFYAFYVLLAALGVAAVNVPVIANVGLWFTRRKGTALGILSAGGPLGQAFVAFVAGHIIVAFGWRTAYLALAVVYATLSIPLALMIRRPPLLVPAPVRDGRRGRPVRCPRPWSWRGSAWPPSSAARRCRCPSSTRSPCSPTAASRTSRPCGSSSSSWAPASSAVSSSGG
jgi:MFS family permease